ncbi:MAG: hypothetical protein AAF632_03575 [Bacteroidota bacterium]
MNIKPKKQTIDLEYYRVNWKREHREMSEKLTAQNVRLRIGEKDRLAFFMFILAERFFGFDRFDELAFSVYFSNPNNRSQQVEFDIILGYDDYLFVHDTRIYPKVEHAQELANKLPDIDDLILFHKGKTVIPIYSSFRVPDLVVDELTKYNIYAMETSEEAMELPNYEALQSR